MRDISAQAVIDRIETALANQNDMSGVASIERLHDAGSVRCHG
jgi:hypothetical protein